MLKAKDSKLSPNNFEVKSMRVFIEQMVKDKYGLKVEEDFLNLEIERLYNELVSDLIKFFLPLIPEKKRIVLNKLVDQDEVFSFLMESIENFELKILHVLINFRKRYV